MSGRIRYSISSSKSTHRVIKTAIVNNLEAFALAANDGSFPADDGVAARSIDRIIADEWRREKQARERTPPGTHETCKAQTFAKSYKRNSKFT